MVCAKIEPKYTTSLLMGASQTFCEKRLLLSLTDWQDMFTTVILSLVHH